MISAGLLNEKVAFLAPVVTQSQYGESVTKWQVVKDKVWARVQYQKGNQILRQGDPIMMHTIVVTIRDGKAYNENQRIRWDGKTYNIDSFNRAHAEGLITITAVRVEESEE